MAFDFSKLPVEMRSCEALRTELMRTHREFADEHSREKAELISETLRLKQIIEEKVGSIQISWFMSIIYYFQYSGKKQRGERVDQRCSETRKRGAGDFHNFMRSVSADETNVAEGQNPCPGRENHAVRGGDPGDQGQPVECAGGEQGAEE